MSLDTSAILVMICTSSLGVLKRTVGVFLLKRTHSAVRNST